jgi:hypothetical protein
MPMPVRTRPAAAEWTDASLPHGTPLLLSGQIQAAWRDASWWARPDVRKVKVAHVVVRSDRLGMRGHAVRGDAAACDPTRIMLDTDGVVLGAAGVRPGIRCRRKGCAVLFAQADKETATGDHASGTDSRFPTVRTQYGR